MKAASDAGIGGAARRPMRVLLALVVSVLLVASLVHAQILDLSGWWKVLDLDYEEIMEFRQEGSVVTFWTVFGTPQDEIPPGTLVNDTLFLVLGEDTLVFHYANDTIRGNDPDGHPLIMVRMPEGPPWVPIRCGTMTIDGQKADWPASFIVCDDPNDDATGGPATEIDRLYMGHDDTCLYMCLELVNDAVFPHSGNNNDSYGIQLADETHELSISVWSPYELRFRNHNSGEEIYFGSRYVAVFGNIIEARVPLSLLNGMSRFYVSGGSEPFDEISALSRLSSCTCGDLDGSGATDAADIVSYIDWAFHGGPAPQELERGEVNCDGRMNLADVVYLIRYIYRFGPAPCANCP